MLPVLVGAGPIVAILNTRDNDHGLHVDFFRSLHTPLTTSWAVLTEAANVLGHSVKAQEALFNLAERGAVKIAALDREDLPSIRKLMRAYSDLPMGLADATLLHLTIQIKANTVFTLDARDFSIYRLGGRKN